MLEINKIYNEDCIGEKGMCLIPDKSVDMILCDLPYGTTACKWDSIIPFDKLWEQYERITKNNGAIVLTATEPFTALLISSNISNFKYKMTWIKDRPSNPLLAKKQPMRYTEDVLIFYKNQPVYNPQMQKRDEKNKRDNKSSMGKIHVSDYTGNSKLIASNNLGDFCYPKNYIMFSKQQNTIHPTQKPVALFEYLIKTYTNEGDLVLDNCMGSGTTAIACINTDRNYIGFEKESMYFEQSLERVKNYIPHQIKGE
jgi:site-specific DNA-methyltransferase (adenine-specific)